MSFYPVTANGPTRLFDVTSYGATGNGTSDDTAAIEAASGALATAQAGVLYFPRGTYKVTSDNVITMNYVGQSILGDGRNASIIAPTSAVTGDLIRWQISPFTEDPAGTIQGIGIDGTDAGSGACGLHVGDILGHALRDFYSSNFTGGTGIHVDNNTNWTEQCDWLNVWVQNNLTGALWDVTGSGTNSWSYNKIRLRVSTADDNQIGVKFQNGGEWYGGDMTIRANLNGSSTGVAMADTTSFFSEFHWAMESDSGSPTGWDVASGVSVQGTGFMELDGLTNTNAGSFNILFWGFFNVPDIEVLSGPGGAVNFAPVFSGGVNIGYTSSLMSSGNGAPDYAATAGNFFFREDTPSVSGQRIYVNETGTAGGWVGIV